MADRRSHEEDSPFLDPVPAESSVSEAVQSLSFGDSKLDLKEESLQIFRTLNYAINTLCVVFNRPCRIGLDKKAKNKLLWTITHRFKYEQPFVSSTATTNSNLKATTFR
jgi:hypothetical protein